MKNRSFLAPSLPLIFSNYQQLQMFPTTENKNSMESYGEGNGTPLQCSCLENPRDREPGGLLSMGSHRVGHDWATSLSLSCIGEGNGNPLQCSCLENPRDRGAWWAAIYGVAQSQTWQATAEAWRAMNRKSNASGTKLNFKCLNMKWDEQT